MFTKKQKNEAELRNDTKVLASGMKAKLNACKKVTVRIPVDKQNPKDTDVVVQLNGYVYQIKRGTTVEVPEPIAKLLERGNYI